MFLARPLRRWVAIPFRRHPPRHDEFGDEYRDDFADLVGSLAADGDHTAVPRRSRRLEIEDIAFDIEHGTRTKRFGSLSWASRESQATLVEG